MGDIKSILLTGATGYLGSRLAKTLIDNGYNVSILKRKQSSISRIEEVLSRSSVYDIEDIDFDELFIEKKIDAIVHTAASYGRKGENMTDVYKANFFFPILLFEMGLKHNVKYFFNSDTTLPPDLNTYSLSKHQFKQVLKLHSDKMNIVNIELQYFYGPNDDVSKFVSFIITKLNSNAAAIDLSPGTQVRDFIYIDDVINAYLKLISKADTFPAYQSVPLGSGEGITLKSLTEKIKTELNNTNSILNFGAVPLRQGEIMYSVADTSFLNKLGWTTQFNIENGLKETIKKEKSLSYDSN